MAALSLGDLQGLIRCEAHGRIQTIRGMCTDEESHVRIDGRLRELDELLLRAVGDLEEPKF